MKLIKLLIILITSIVFISCNTEQTESREVNQQLKEERILLESESNALKSSIETMYKHRLELVEEVKELQSINKDSQYIIKLMIKQSTFTLSLSEHMKNSANAIYLEIPVQYDYYRLLKVSDNITDNFKIGSFIVDGDFSNLRVEVVDKRIQ